ncbi:hypothetical protein CBR_g31306 [Chara braunii]|uniref:Uncharacterized protein n=1 Tax=Chara braunii TaxID=69332 RepID=A0A388LEN3_CHABU|nr:hypothetical protein CBR_g31306 [Chara braunii]|eukprot:GBG80751.1 hypothetical protein CBR_g31306 [Chara braunii]
MRAMEQHNGMNTEDPNGFLGPDGMSDLQLARDQCFEIGILLRNLNMGNVCEEDEDEDTLEMDADEEVDQHTVKWMKEHAVVISFVHQDEDPIPLNLKRQLIRVYEAAWVKDNNGAAVMQRGTLRNEGASMISYVPPKQEIAEFLIKKGSAKIPLVDEGLVVVASPSADVADAGTVPTVLAGGLRIDLHSSCFVVFVAAVGVAHLHSLVACVTPLAVAAVLVVAAVGVVEAMCTNASVGVAAIFVFAFVLHALVVAGADVAGVASGIAAVAGHLADTVAKDVVLVVPDADRACGVVVVAVSAFACLTGAGYAAVSACPGPVVAAFATVPLEHAVLAVSVPPRIVPVVVVPFGLAHAAP